MRSIALSLLTLLLPAVGAAAQGAAAVPAGGSSVAAVRDNWRQVTTFVTQSADEVPEADYAFRPVETVRTFGQLIGHVAGAQRMICAAALGEPMPPEDAVEKAATTKEALVKALRESTTYCDRAYAQGDAAVAGGVRLFGQEMTRLHALTLNAVHNGEHYGNIITYMRMKGMVPPSSRRQ